MCHKFIFLAFCMFSVYTVQAQNYVLTQRGNNQRTGSYTHEKKLNISNVTVDGFGKLYNYPVDGHIYAQPLYVPGLDIAGKGKRNVLFIATMHNTIYAFDADSLTSPLWQTSLGPSCPVPDPNFGYRYGAYHDIQVEVGTTSTPVIDTGTNTLYAVAFTKESGKYYHKLYAIDITTGNFKIQSPVQLKATIAGNGAGSSNNIITFDSKQQLQRTALVLSKGIIYIIFAGYADTDPYHGWVLGYSADSLAQKYVFNTTPNGAEGGIWMSGQGPSFDENGDMYLETGNGDFDANTGGTDYGDSFIKFHPTTDSLNVSDYFTPYNQAYLSSVDADLGVDAPIIIPNSNMVVGGSKEGKIYVVNRNNLGKYNTSACQCDSQILESFPAFNGLLHGSVAYWDSNNGGYLYGWSANDHLKAFKRNGNHFGTTPSSESTFSAPNGLPGGMLSITSNDTGNGTGIVWANIPLVGDANSNVVPGVLRAFDATDVSKELWNSQEYSFRDAFGNFAKFNAPTIVNGRVYQPTFSKQVTVYGLNPPTVYREPDNPAKVSKGLNYKYFKGSYSTLPNFNSLKPVKQDSINNFSLSPADVSVNYGFSFQGYIKISQDGLYTFYLNSDDGSNLLIGNNIVVNNDGLHAAQEVHGTIGLKAGKHAITVNYFQSGGGANLNVSYSDSGFSKIPIPDSVLYRDPVVFTSAKPFIQNNSGAFLNQNIPNPASGNTKIEFGVDRPGKVTITLFRLDGTQVNVLFEGTINERASIDLDSHELPDGMYIYRMVTGNVIITKSLLIIK